MENKVKKAYMKLFNLTAKEAEVIILEDKKLMKKEEHKRKLEKEQESLRKKQKQRMMNAHKAMEEKRFSDLFEKSVKVNDKRKHSNEMNVSAKKARFSS